MDSSSTSRGSASADDLQELCPGSIRIMAAGDLADFEAVIHPSATNWEANHEPADCRGAGSRAFHASALWLRGAFADSRWDTEEAMADGDLVVLHATM